MESKKEFTKGIWAENPVFVMILSICPSMATTSNLSNAFCMGLAVIFVLIFSNIIISLIRKAIPGEIRIPCYIVVIASFVTITDLAMHAYLPLKIYEALGIFIPLIVVNCIILGRAEAFASKNNVWKSFLDGLGMGIGFTLALCIIGFTREIIGNGTICNYQIVSFFTSKNNNPNAWIEPISVFSQPAGGFLVIGLYLGLFSYLRRQKKLKEVAKAK
ncbi:MAG: electron transport complex subunit E [Candidatus Brocadiae bacterium]|nr:electron transport complex subunit E [Candidatus Brocadiia bacterium]